MAEGATAPVPAPSPAPAEAAVVVAPPTALAQDKPKSTQFQPGKSGNPNGRPKGVPNRNTSLLRACAERAKLKGTSFEVELIDEAFRLSKAHSDPTLLMEIMKRAYITVTPEAAGLAVQINNNPTAVVQQYEGLVQAIRAARVAGVDNPYEDLGEGLKP